MAPCSSACCLYSCCSPTRGTQVQCDDLLSLRCQVFNRPLEPASMCPEGHGTRTGSLAAKWNYSDGYFSEDDQVLICTETYLSCYRSLSLCCKKKIWPALGVLLRLHYTYLFFIFVLYYSSYFSPQNVSFEFLPKTLLYICSF